MLRWNWSLREVWWINRKNCHKRQTHEASLSCLLKSLLFIKQKRLAIYHCFYPPPSCSKGISREMDEKNMMTVTFFSQCQRVVYLLVNTGVLFSKKDFCSIVHHYGSIHIRIHWNIMKTIFSEGRLISCIAYRLDSFMH